MRFLTTLEECFVRSGTTETSATLKKLVSMRYRGDTNIRRYVLEMFHLAGKLKGLKTELPEYVRVHLVLISFPPRFSRCGVSYNCQKEKWTLNELIAYLT